VFTHSRVAVPQIHIDLRNRLAGVGVDQLDVHIEWNTFLSLRDVLANEFTSDI
jgi:hypothetical protein